MRPKNLGFPGGNLNTELALGQGILDSCHMSAQQASIIVNSAFFFFFAEFLDNLPVLGRASSNGLKWEEFHELIWVISQRSMQSHQQYLRCLHCDPAAARILQGCQNRLVTGRVLKMGSAFRGSSQAIPEAQLHRLATTSGGLWGSDIKPQ